MVEKIKLFILLQLVFALTCNAQITNGSFEDCGGCSSTLPNGVTQFSYVSNWQYFGTPDWYSNQPGLWNPYTSTSDIYCGSLTAEFNPHSGTHFVGIFNQEGIVYDYGSNLAKGYYTITLWTNSCESSWSVRMLGSAGSPSTDEGGCDVSASSLHSFGTQSLNNTGGWQKKTFEFEISAGEDVRYLTITGDVHGYGCLNVAYFFIDDVSMDYQQCCPFNVKYQYYDLVTPLVERSDYIEFCESCLVDVPVGSVHIPDNSTVTLRAGQFIYVPQTSLVQGNNVNFIAEIVPCSGSDNDYYTNCSFQPIAISNAPIITCDNSTEGGLRIWSLGCATNYTVHVYDDWGMALDVSGDLTGFETDYYNGTSYTFIPGDTYVAYVTLRNCDKDSSFVYAFNVVDNTCGSAKRDLTDDNKISENDSLYLEIRPNPTSGSTFVTWMMTETANVRMDIFDVLGHPVSSKENIIQGRYTQGTYHEHIDLSALKSGMYLIQTHIGERIFSDKIVLIK